LLPQYGEKYDENVMQETCGSSGALGLVSLGNPKVAPNGSLEVAA